MTAQRGRATSSCLDLRRFAPHNPVQSEEQKKCTLFSTKFRLSCAFVAFAGSLRYAVAVPVASGDRNGIIISRDKKRLLNLCPDRAVHASRRARSCARRNESGKPEKFFPLFFARRAEFRNYAQSFPFCVFRLLFTPESSGMLDQLKAVRRMALPTRFC